MIALDLLDSGQGPVGIFENMVMNFRFSYQAGNFLTS